MRINLGCQLQFSFPQETPMVAVLNVHYSHFGDLERPDFMVSSPSVPLESYRDGFGNWCTRLIAPSGDFELKTDGIFLDKGEPDPIALGAMQFDVQHLPADTLVYLLGSRYCETDLLSEEAWHLFENTAPGWARVQAICDFVNDHVTFGYEHARATRTAFETMTECKGVCRDYTHLAITLCRCLNIPARYCTGYLSDIGEQAPYPPGDFAAWMEVYLSGRWWVFDPRNNTRRIGRILVARGRDAADVPLTQTFGKNTLMNFTVWANEVQENEGE
ncbi:transglutaminase family protein [Cohaesibacter marisflavi]|uniref:transglutaminase-like domain-containing protein n=1 Tax=Cohaesibacter marisflavi TaxID=655353 RepID=UPI0029C7FA1E|nr:transglutaminase family protein [Cohaesibacter marisflavi]